MTNQFCPILMAAAISIGSDDLQPCLESSCPWWIAEKRDHDIGHCVIKDLKYLSELSDMESSIRTMKQF